MRWVEMATKVRTEGAEVPDRAFIELPPRGKVPT